MSEVTVATSDSGVHRVSGSDICGGRKNEKGDDYALQQWSSAFFLRKTRLPEIDIEMG
jgi:hypothetical protein